MSETPTIYPTGHLTRRDAMLLAGVVLITLAVRGITWPLDPVISRDGATFVTLADRFNDGQYRRFFGLIPNVPGNYHRRDFTDFLGQEQRQHPLYPLLIACTARMTGDGVLAGKLISIILGTLTVVPLYLLTRRLFGAEAALSASVLFAFHAYMVREAVDVLTEPTFLFFFTLCVWLTYEAVVKRCLVLTFCTALVAGCAYLTRPEGFGLLFVLLGTIGLWGITRRPRRWSWRIVGSLVAVAGFFVVALPYLVVIHEVLGVWWITMKKPPFFINRLQTTSSLPWMLATIEAGSIAYDVWYGFWKAFHPLVLVFAITGVALRRHVRRHADELYLAGVFALYFLIVLSSRIGGRYLSRRHVFALLMTALPFAGLAVVEVASLLARRRRGPARRKRMRTFVLVILALCALVLGLKTFPGAVGSDHVLRAGRWVAENCPPGEDGKLRLMTAADSRIGFYAGAADRQFPLDWIARFHKGHYKEPLSVDIILTWAKRQKPPLRRLIVQKEELDEYAPGLLEKLDADSRFRRLVRIDNEDNDDEEAVIVYEILYERPPLPPDEERP